MKSEQPKSSAETQAIAGDVALGLGLTIPREQPKTSDVTSMRKEFEGLSRNFVEIRDAYGRIKATAQDPSPAGDLSLMFNYMKMLDPGSVVRESEFAQIAATGAYGERMKALAERYLSGLRLTDVQRADFLFQAENIYRKALQSHQNLEEHYRELAGRAGIDSRNVVTPFYREEQPAEGDAGRFKAMSLGELQDLNIDQLTADEVVAYNARMEELLGQ